MLFTENKILLKQRVGLYSSHWVLKSMMSLPYSTSKYFGILCHVTNLLIILTAFLKNNWENYTTVINLITFVTVEFKLTNTKDNVLYFTNSLYHGFIQFYKILVLFEIMFRMQRNSRLCLQPPPPPKVPTKTQGETTK
jgi:hypothetical protein